MDRFAEAMKSKMCKARAKGRGGWDDRLMVSDEALAKMLIEHLGKGNDGTFEDVANFAMMLYMRDADPEVLANAAGAPIKKARREVLELGIRALESKPSASTAALVEALERVKLTEREARHHSVHNAAYWNNAVTACIDAAYRAQQEVK